MKHSKPIKKIVLTGPESTGKTTLSEQLSYEYNTIHIQEFAREYIEKLSGDYKYKDVVAIAKKQIHLFNKQYNANNFVFFDTGLIITKIWFKEVYNKIPDFIEVALNEIKIDSYLLCYPDIKWIPDNVRENGGNKRLDLFYKYKNELDKTNSKYFIIKGDNETRFLSAKKYLSSAYCL